MDSSVIELMKCTIEEEKGLEQRIDEVVSIATYVQGIGYICTYVVTWNGEIGKHMQILLCTIK